MRKLTLDRRWDSPVEIKLEVDTFDEAIRLAAKLSRDEMLPVHIDPTGVGLAFVQALEENGVKVVREFADA